MAGWQEQRGSRGGVHQVSFWVRFRCFVFFFRRPSRGRGPFEFEVGVGLGLNLGRGNSLKLQNPNEERTKRKLGHQIGRIGIGWKTSPEVQRFLDLGFEPARRETGEW